MYTNPAIGLNAYDTLVYDAQKRKLPDREVLPPLGGMARVAPAGSQPAAVMGSPTTDDCGCAGPGRCAALALLSSPAMVH